MMEEPQTNFEEAAAESNVMIDDIVGQRVDGEYKFGAVVQSYSSELLSLNLNIEIQLL